VENGTSQHGTEGTGHGHPHGHAARARRRRRPGSRGLWARLVAPLVLAFLPALTGIASPDPAAPPPDDAPEAEEPNDGRPPARRPRVVTHGEAIAPQGVGPAPDASVMPTLRTPPVVSTPVMAPGAKPRPRPRGLRGLSEALAAPRVVDTRRRQARTARPTDFGATLAPGERFRFDVTFAGNPAGLAEAAVVAVEPDPRGPPPAGAPMIRLEGHARTSGVVSLLATVTDEMVTYVDAHTGAAISSHNVLRYSGFAPRGYKLRDTKHAYEGRGQVRIVDIKDDVVEKKLHRVPLDTYDSLSVMAWVRSLRLEKGERAKAHVVDGLTLMRVDIESLGRDRLDPLPSMAAALGLRPEDTVRIEGFITRVDEHGVAIPGKRPFMLRAWLSADERRIPLVMESDLWVGAIRLVISGYDPPDQAPRDPAPARPRPSPAP
jgi:hypothetical protein